MLLNHTGGLLLRLAVALVVAKEYVLEARLIARERDDGVPGRGLDHGVGGALHGQPDGVALVQLLDLFHPLERIERIGGHRRGERDSELIALDCLDLSHAADAHQAAFPDDAHARAGLLDLAQDVGREKYRPPLITASLTMPSNSCWFSGSRPLVGSSRMSSRGRCMKAWMSTTLRLFPVEYWRNLRLVSRSIRSMSFFRYARSTPPRRFAKYSRICPPVRLGSSEGSPGT